MKRFQFWYTWLVGACGCMILIGVFMCSLGLRKADPVTDPFLRSLLHPSTQVSEPMTIFYWWILGVLGAVMIGWAISLYFIIRNAFRHQERWAWSSIISAMSVWYLLDTSISLYYGIPLNAVLNTMLLLLFLVPLLATRRSFS